MGEKEPHRAARLIGSADILVGLGRLFWTQMSAEPDISFFGVSATISAEYDDRQLALTHSNQEDSLWQSGEMADGRK
jgi:hypothetical protein